MPLAAHCSRSLCLTLTLLALMPLDAFAQPPAVHADMSAPPPPLGPVNGAAIKPGRIRYITRLMSDGQARRLGYRVLDVTDTTYGSTAAWLFVDAQHIGPNYTIADSLFVTKTDLAPLHEVSHRPGNDVETTFGRDSIRGVYDTEQGRKTVAMAAAPGAIATSYVLETILRVVPLRAGWGATVPMLALGIGSTGTVPVQLRVTGEETQRLPDGEFDCWVLTLSAAQGEQKLYVRKRDQWVVRTTIPATGIANGYVELLLAQGETKR